MTSGPAATFVDRVRETVRRHDLFPSALGGVSRGTGERGSVREGGGPREGAGACALVAVSGGADSVALLLVLADLAAEGLVPPLVVAHLHHGLRAGAADEDEAFAASLAARMGLPCETARADVPAEARAQGLGIEEAARLARRRFLADAARRRDARQVALGHTADDRAETVLFNVLRGTGIEGLAALAPRAPLDAGAEIEIVRPLLEVTRAQVLEFLRARGQAWREDESNADPAYTRNRLRQDVLPLAREAVNPRADEALARLADQAAAAGEVLEDALQAVWRQVVRPAAGGGALVIDADDFTPLRPWMQGAILRRAVERLGGGLKHMSADRTREVVAALLAKTVAGPIDLPGNLVATRRRRAIRIGPRPSAPPGLTAKDAESAKNGTD
jgi:tRNA(Ile)-lysidine synthase